MPHNLARMQEPAYVNQPDPPELKEITLTFGEIPIRNQKGRVLFYLNEPTVTFAWKRKEITVEYVKLDGEYLRPSDPHDNWLLEQIDARFAAPDWQRRLRAEWAEKEMDQQEDA